MEFSDDSRAMNLVPEDSTPIDPDESAGLRLSYITTRAELNAAEAINVESGLRWAGRSRGLDELLNIDFLRELHRRMFGEVWKWAGTFRRTDKNIGADWWEVREAVTDVVRDFAALTTSKGLAWPIDEIGVRFHYRLVSIHPFPNGNGRHSRASADLLIEALGTERFTWGEKNLVNASETRARYIKALRAADGGDFDPLLTFVRS